MTPACVRAWVIEVGLGVENMAGGGMGPISDTGIGGSGNSDRNICGPECAILLLPGCCGLSPCAS